MRKTLKNIVIFQIELLQIIIVIIVIVRKQSQRGAEECSTQPKRISKDKFDQILY